MGLLHNVGTTTPPFGGLLQKPAYVIPGLTRDPLISLKYGIAGQARNDEKVFCNSAAAGGGVVQPRFATAPYSLK